MVKNSLKCTSAYLFANSPDNSNYLLPLVEATNICMKMLKKWNFSQEIELGAKSELLTLAIGDLDIRITQSRKVKDKEGRGEKYISFDSVAEWLLKKWVNRQEGILIMLQATFGRYGTIEKNSKTFEDIMGAVYIYLSSRFPVWRISICLYPTQDCWTWSTRNT